MKLQPRRPASLINVAITLDRDTGVRTFEAIWADKTRLSADPKSSEAKRLAERAEAMGLELQRYAVGGWDE